MAGDLQTVPARAGTATFVPAGGIIKIVNTSGVQAVDTWAFALPSPPKKDESAGEKERPQSKKEDKKPAKTDEVKEQQPKATPKKGRSARGTIDLPSQEEAEQATAQGTSAAQDAPDSSQKKGWSSYLPSIPLRSAKTDTEQAAKQKENSKTWSQYFSVGQGFTSYIPSTKSISSFASSHYRDPNKPLVQQITDFSRTPVGAAGISALSGQGYASSLYAGYSAWSTGGQDAPVMEFLSMPHSRAATGRIVPRQGDTLVSNLREPLLSVVEDTSGGVHDTLIAASDPQLYRSLGVEKWEEYGSSAENLVLALKELNDRAGLKGPKGIGADITVNSVPSPLNLFRAVSWDEDGKLNLDASASKSKKGGHIRLRAERDVVVVLSAGPSLDGKGKPPQDAHFAVEEDTDDSEEVRKRLESASGINANSAPARPAPTKRASNPPRKLNSGSSRATAGPSAPRPAPAASAAHAPIGTVKKPKAQAPSGTRNAAATPSSSANATPAAGDQTPASRNDSRPPQTPRSPASQRKSSTSTVPSHVKHPGGASTVAGTSSSGAPSSAGAERRKPRKIQRRAG